MEQMLSLKIHIVAETNKGSYSRIFRFNEEGLAELNEVIAKIDEANNAEEIVEHLFVDEN